jgi:hypothetical protein
VTTGGAISGYWAIGSERIAARPATMSNTEMTTAKIGRSMKNRENIGAYSAYRVAVSAAGAAAAGG